MASSHHEDAAQRLAARIAQHEARLAELAERDGVLDCTGDGTFRVCKRSTTPSKGPLVLPGFRAEVQYTGWLAPAGDDAPKLDDALVAAATKGKPFDSSRGNAAPFSFLAGGGQVIGGWDATVTAMRVGERAMILVAPEHGYGARGAGPIPPGAWLLFDVEVVSAEPVPEPAFSTPSLIGLLFVVAISAYYLLFRIDDIEEGSAPEL
mmetsp:Transcript_24838/g.74688  ORF Transcript_24838/g.74688 Transcript_24838/m.74688 type:complete len:207 (-) Transcript_24838:29-649(-)